MTNLFLLWLGTNESYIRHYVLFQKLQFPTGEELQLATTLKGLNDSNSLNDFGCMITKLRIRVDFV